jgi:hypothetical protein
MKYQELYDHAIKNEAFVVEFDTNLIPTKGWAIVRWRGGLHINITPDGFDLAVKEALRLGHDGSTHLIILQESLGMTIGHGVVYNNQQFAMGYAMGRGVDFIIDCYTGKKVVRR